MGGYLSKYFYGDERDVNRDGAERLGKTRDSGPGRTARDIQEMKEAVKGGPAKAKEYLDKKNNEWKKVPLNIGVSGASGVGKSSFINTIRGIEEGEEGYAEEGVVDTTHEVRKYPHQDNNNLIFWDMPGVGTLDYPMEGYLEKVEFDKYDFFLILTSKRLRNEDVILSKQVQNLRKSFFLLRTHTHEDVKTERKKDPENYVEEITLQRIRRYITDNLAKIRVYDIEIFLIDNKKPNLYDFDRLVTRLIDGIADEKKKEAFVFSLKALTEGLINEKKKHLEKRIWRCATLSALSGSVPIPGLGASVDTALILAQSSYYRQQLGLTDEELRTKIPPSSKFYFVLRDRFTFLSSHLVFLITADEAAETALKFAVPIFGGVLAGTLSFGVTYATLKKILDEMAEEALKLHTQY